MEDRVHEGWEVAKVAISRACGKLVVADGDEIEYMTAGELKTARAKEARARRLTMLCLGMWVGAMGVCVGVP